MYAISDIVSHTPPTVIQATAGLSAIVNALVYTCSAFARWFYRWRPRRGVDAALSAGVRRSDFFSILTEVLKEVLLWHALDTSVSMCVDTTKFAFTDGKRQTSQVIIVQIADRPIYD